MTLSKCTRCSGTGFKGKVVCVYCNSRGVICSELYSQELIDFDRKRL